MSSIFASTRNTRLLLPGSWRFVRSDVPDALTQDEIAALRANGVDTLVDLRSDGERERRPIPWREGFAYHALPVTGGNALPERPEAVPGAYLAMCDERMEEILSVLWAAKGAMYFCSAGKDRTGVVSALLLRRLGLDDETIVGDYLLTKDNLMPWLLRHKERHPECDLAVVTPCENHIRGFLRLLDERSATT